MMNTEWLNHVARPFAAWDERLQRAIRARAEEMDHLVGFPIDAGGVRTRLEINQWASAMTWTYRSLN